MVNYEWRMACTYTVRHSPFTINHSQFAMDDPLRPHSHDNNVIVPKPYAHNPQITIMTDGIKRTFTLSDLHSLPQTTLSYTYTTDHGRHGPYQLSGVSVADLFSQLDVNRFTEIEVISADGFGNRIDAAELDTADIPILLCTTSDDQQLTAESGLIRLVVPTETDNALRQIKWVEQIRLL